MRFDGLTRDELVEQRRPYVEKTRRDYRKFWQENVMATKSITIQVDAEAARAFAEASPDEQKKLQLLLSLRLQELTTKPGKALQTVMDEIGKSAAARGLTPEILESILRDE